MNPGSERRRETPAEGGTPRDRRSRRDRDRIEAGTVVAIDEARHRRFRHSKPGAMRRRRGGRTSSRLKSSLVSSEEVQPIVLRGTRIELGREERVRVGPEIEPAGDSSFRAASPVVESSCSGHHRSRPRAIEEAQKDEDEKPNPMFA
jgi:hypothetical protein